MPKTRRGIKAVTRQVGRPKRNRPKSVEKPQFELAGQHVVSFLALVFAALWFAGLLPDP